MPIPAGYTQLTTGFWRKDSDLSGPYAWTGAAFYLISTGVAGSGVAADYTQHPSGFWFKTADGSGPYSYDGTDFWLAGNGGPSGAITVATVNVSSAINMANGSTFNLYNTADQTTNYERLRASWLSNVAQIFVSADGSGAQRALQVGITYTDGAGAPQTYTQWNPSSPWINHVFATDAAAGTGLGQHRLYSGTISAASGTQVPVSITPTINQSGTAGATILNVDPIVTATGSGTYLVQRWGWNGTTLAQINFLGTLTSIDLSTANYLTFRGGSLSATQDIFLTRDAADTLAQRRGTNAQTFRGYETYTDASNYSRWYQTFSGGFAYYGTQAAGTGIRRPLILQHHTMKVAALPDAATAGAGSRAFVSDATAPAFGVAVVGGGTVNSPVYSDGHNWVVG